MVVSYLEANITFLNALLNKNGIYNALIPSAIVLVTPKIDDTHATIQPGPYVNFKIKSRNTNNIKTSSVAEITFRRSN